MSKEKLNNFFNELNEFEKKTNWRYAFIPEMRIGEGNTLYMQEEFGESVKVLPYSENALPTILARAECECKAIHRVAKTLFLAHINEYFRVAKRKNSIVNIYDGTVYAAHSEGYKILNIKECAERFVDYITSTYESAKLIGYSITPTETIVDFAINDETLNKRYQKALQRKVDGENIYPFVRFISSNTGWSGANIIPMLLYKNARLITCEPIILKHQGKADVEKFSENCNKTFALMYDAAEEIEHLANVTIEYPANCAANIAKEINLPKKITMPVILDMQDDYGDMSCTARDVYLYLTKILAKYDNDVKQFKIADHLARVLTLDIKKFDRAKAPWLDGSTSSRYAPASQISFNDAA